MERGLVLDVLEAGVAVKWYIPADMSRRGISDI